MADDQFEDDDYHDHCDVVLLPTAVVERTLLHQPFRGLQIADQRDVETDEQDERKDEEAGRVEDVQVDHLEVPVSAEGRFRQIVFLVEAAAAVAGKAAVACDAGVEVVSHLALVSDSVLEESRGVDQRRHQQNTTDLRTNI